MRLFVAAKVVFVSASHHLMSENKQCLKDVPVIIGEDSWIRENLTILPRVNVGCRTIVNAGSVITKSFLHEHIVIDGNPAKPITKLT
jgi:acetyltransferase-like isoleucine patch superfamily enzyme